MVEANLEMLSIIRKYLHELISLTKIGLELKQIELRLVEEHILKVVMPEQPDKAALLKEQIQVTYEHKELALERQDLRQAWEAVRLESRTEGHQAPHYIQDAGLDMPWVPQPNVEGLQVLPRARASAMAESSTTGEQKRLASDMHTQQTQKRVEWMERRKAAEWESQQGKGKCRMIVIDSNDE